MNLNEFSESMTCSECGGPAFSDLLLAEKKDACYSKVRSRYKVWPSAYASGALVQCRKKGAANWGNKSKNESVAEMDSQQPTGRIKPDGTRSHSTYGSRDHYSLGDPETTLGPDSVLTAKDVAKKASQTLNKVFGKSHKKGMAEGLNEFAPPGSNDSGNDGFSEETLKRLAAQWYNGDEDPRVERTLMAAGWEIGQDEGYDDEPGVFVVQSGDVNGSSYISWPAHELKQGVAEAQLDEKCWDTHKQVGMKNKGGRQVPNCVPRESVAEAGSPAQQAAIAINMKKKGQKPMNEYSAEYDDEAGMADNNLETLQRAVQGIDELIDSGDNLPEWCQEKIAVAKSMLVAVWDYMYSEEASDEVDPEVDAMFEAIDSMAAALARKYNISLDEAWESFESLPDHVLYETAQFRLGVLNEDWQKVNKRDKTDGMSRKAVKAYRRENPGSKLKTAVTTKPSKLKKGGKAAKRRKSFCARMRGMKKSRASAKTKRNPNSPINKALRRWNC